METMGKRMMRGCGDNRREERKFEYFNCTKLISVISFAEFE